MSKVLVIGNGGREHALGWKLAQSSHVDKLFFAPGNPGMTELGEPVDISITDADNLTRFALDNKVDLTVVGPDDSLAQGVVDEFEKHNLKVFGPRQSAARLEWDKIFAHDFMTRHSIPHPDGYGFDDFEAALRYIQTHEPENIVIKASGLAAGKGVILPNNQDEARQALTDMMIGHKFGEAGRNVLIQNRLHGKEISVFVICSGKDYILLPVCQDYKRLLNGDKGPNTGGMGVVAPVQILSPKEMKFVEQDIIIPTLEGMLAEQNPYSGVLYLGLMQTEDGIKVIEYNARFGDPETQSLMPLINGDLFELMLAVANGAELSPLEIASKSTAVVVLASHNYPYGKSDPKVVYGLPRKDILVFQAGTKISDASVMASGGRVLNVVGQGDDIDNALAKAYDAIGEDGIHFDGMQYRTDIGRNL